MNYNHKITGEVIGELRIHHKLSQEVLAGLSGIARSHLALIETGKKNANVETLWKIADAFNMRLSKLFQLVEEKTIMEMKLKHRPNDIG